MPVVFTEPIVLALFGLLGGLVRHVASHQGKIVLPHMDKDDQANLILDMGFLYNVFVGCVAGLLVPYGLGALVRLILPQFPQVMNNVVTALLGGYSSAHFFEKALEYFIDKVPGVTNPRGGVPF